MRSIPHRTWLLAAVASGLIVASTRAATGTDWPSWRGQDGTGSVAEASLPVTWSESDNIAWKLALPGEGSGSPIVWGETIYLMTAIPTEEGEAEPEPPSDGDRRGRRGTRGVTAAGPVAFTLLAIDRSDGGVLWEEMAREETPHEGHHSTASFASASAVTDGEVVLAHFGSRGLYCYDLDGKKLWDIDLGDMATRNSFGEGSSPAIFGDTVVVPWDHEGDSFVVALDRKTGKERWRQARPEATSWATPLVVDGEGGPQAILNGTTVRSYDLKSGKLRWSLGGMTSNPIPTPIYQGGLLFVTTGYRGSALRAIDLAAAKGDITGGDAVVWARDEDTPYVPTPLLHRGVLYFLKSNSGILTACDAKTGKTLYGPVRLEQSPNVYASPVGAGDHVYINGRDGATVVIQAGPEFKVLAVNELDEGSDASIAISGDEILLRTRQHLYCIAAREGA